MSGIPPLNAAGSILSLFDGRQDCFGEQADNGAYYTQKKKLTQREIEKHLLGEKTIGVYLLKKGRVTFAALDFDSKGPQAKEAILYCQRWLNGWAIPSFIEPSGNKGLHLWVFFKDWVSADKVRKVLFYLLESLESDTGISEPEGHPIEIFPKQSGGVDLGNLIKLPFGIHRVTGKRTRFITHDNHIIELDDILASPAINEDILDVIIENIPGLPDTAHEPTQQPQGQGLPCFSNTSATIIEEGARHAIGFRRSVHLFRQGHAKDAAEALMILWDEENCRPSIGAKVIKRNITSAYSGKYGFGCLDPIIQKYCDPSCPIHKKRHLQTDNPPEGAPESEVGPIREILTHPPKWEVTARVIVDDENHEATVILTTTELFSLKVVQNRFFERLRVRLFTNMKPGDWINYIQSLGISGKIEVEDAPYDASKEEMVAKRIYDWLGTTPKAISESDVMAGRPIDRSGRYYFLPEAVEDMLKRRYHISIGRDDLYLTIRNIGGAIGRDKGTLVKFSHKTFRAWSLPHIVVEEPNTQQQLDTDDPDAELDF
ncbi:MAG: hypothetical protein DDT32_01727 [Syntrophomonadaceae bacterium]|nr:hypothetical protein [Bacillota bacterium]